MRIDSLPKPDTLWFEDEKGEKLDVDTSQGMPDFPEEQEWYMHSYSADVQHHINTRRESAKWPVRFFRWLANKCPNGWQGHSGNLCTGNTTINCLYPVVKHLVETKKWGFTEAVIAASNLCERCMNICLWECEGHDLDLEKRYLSNSKTYCDSCKHIDLDYAERHRVWCCYRTLKLGGDVSKAWNEITVDSAPGYWDYPSCPDKDPNMFQRAMHKVKLFFSNKQIPKGAHP